MDFRPISRATPNWVDVGKYDLRVGCCLPICHHSRIMTTCFKIGLGDITSFHRCSSCEYNSITKRHVVPQIPCKEYAVRAMYESSWAIIEAIKVLGITAWSRAEVVATRPARMKKRYNNILHNDRLTWSAVHFMPPPQLPSDVLGLMGCHTPPFAASLTAGQFLIQDQPPQDPGR